MAYYIAIASSNGKNVDLKFGETRQFYVYEVEEKDLALKEIRNAQERDAQSDGASSCNEGGNGGCSGSGGGCSGNGGGCGGGAEVIGKVALIEDCRAVVCKKVGFQAQKQFEKKAISVFDVECSVEEALEKITSYYYKIDNRQSLRSREVPTEEA